MSDEASKVVKFVYELRDFVYDLGLLASRFREKADVLESMMDEVKELINLPKTNKEEIKVLTKAVIISSKLSINGLINELNKAKEELETWEKKWGEIYGDNTN